MNDQPSIAKFTVFVELKSRKASPRDGNFRGPTRKEYVRDVRRRGEHHQCDPATLTEHPRLHVRRGKGGEDRFVPSRRRW